MGHIELAFRTVVSHLVLQAMRRGRHLLAIETSSLEKGHLCPSYSRHRPDGNGILVAAIC